MKQKTFLGICGWVFSLVAALHLCRALLHWEAVVNGRMVPIWVSWAAVAFSGYLAVAAFRLRK